MREGSRQQLRELRDNDALFKVDKVYVKHDDGCYYETVDDDDLDYEDAAVARISTTMKSTMMDAVEDVPEVALPRTTRRQLNRAQSSFCALHECQNSKVDVGEVYSPPRVTTEARKQGLRAGNAYDILTGFDLRLTKDIAKMWKELRHDRPALTIGSSPCTPFSPLQAWNWPRMNFAKAVQLLGEGLGHWAVNCQVARWQYDEGRLFLVEHPLPSKAWEEPCAQELMNLPGVHCGGR